MHRYVQRLTDMKQDFRGECFMFGHGCYLSIVDGIDLEKPASSPLLNPIYQRPDLIDADLNLISALQPERIRRNDSRARQQKASVPEALITKQIFHQRLRLSLQLGQRGRRRELHLVASQNLDVNR